MKRSTIIQLAQEDFQHELVSIVPSRIAKVPWKRVSTLKIEMPWLRPAHPDVFLQCLITMGALNFRLWHSAKGTTSLCRYVRGEKSGARALWMAFAAHWTDDADVFRQRLSVLDVPGIFGDIPDVQSRRVLLDEVLQGRALEQLATQICQEVIELGQVRIRHAHLLATRFPKSFEDPYLHKAQLLLWMFAAQLSNLNIQVDCSDLTGFAEFQMPRMLQAVGITHYNSDIQQAIHLQQPLEQGGCMERAIRGATIMACELIAKHTGCRPADVGDMLRHSLPLAAGQKFHLTHTTHY